MAVNQKFKFSLTGIVLFLFLVLVCRADKYDQWYERLKVDYAGDAKIEVGGPYVGVEFHHSLCVPQRISFFYPAANSIDLSTDYWHRDTTLVMALGLQIGDGEKEWLGGKPFTFSLTPYKVTFRSEDALKAIEICYQFTKNQPAMVITYRITNRSDQLQKFQFDSHLATTLRTSHSFKQKKHAWTEYDPKTAAIYSNHPDPETKMAQIFVANAAAQPQEYHAIGPLKTYFPVDNNQWPAGPRLVPQEKPAETAARFLYQAELANGENLTVIQIIGTAGTSEGRSVVSKLRTNLIKEIELYEHGILASIFDQELITTEDQDLNHSAAWAKAILAANKHYLDGEMVPMPCPAEYNFYFTHDVLVTDLAAVNFDPERVKKDLDFIVRHANEQKIIPHAYYWKDSMYVTEYADRDNWNNFWMIIASATYLRHSADTSFVRYLYPYIGKCLETALQNKEKDNLMWSYRPDWWDIGRNYGPRSYMTILATKALRDYIYIGSILDAAADDLYSYEVLADSMQTSLIEHLWHKDMQYLVNYYQDKSLDPHYYIGSLLAAHYGLLDSAKLKALVSSAGKNLLDPKTGIYNAYPMDFHELIDYLKFAGNEAGATGFYANGGIWPQGNAWYALALIADDLREESYQFIKNTMTLAGIMAGPNGQPAMYEVRNSNRSDTDVYGTVDKPQFMWAGAWYLYALYHLFAITEDSWNIGFAPYLPEGHKSGTYLLNVHGRTLKVQVEGKGASVRQVIFNDVVYPSVVIPAEIGPVKEVKVELGQPTDPYLNYSNSVLISSSYDQASKQLSLHLRAFTGHKNETRIISPLVIKSVWSDGKDLTNSIRMVKNDFYSEYTVYSEHEDAVKEMTFEFR